MTIPRLYQPIALASAASVTLDVHASHHLARVLRAKVGDSIILFNGEGGEYAATITHIDKKNVTVTVEKFIDRDVESPLQLYLAQGIARGEKMDFIVQKAVELGVTKIFPLMTERVNVQLKGEREAKRLTHWQSVVVSACEQSGRNRVPEVMALQLLADFLQTVKTDHGFVLSPHVGGGLSEKKIESSQSVAVLIGPEGGLSDNELAMAVDRGYLSLQLGRRILRTETAGMVALAVLQHRFGDLSLS